MIVAELDWVTISSLATAGGTLVLALATFAAVRSSNRAARAAEESLLLGLRPLLVPSRLDDPAQKVGFADSRWFSVPGGGGIAEVADDAVYLIISVRNAGNGIAVLHGWHFYPRTTFGVAEHAPLDSFVRLTRDLYVAPGDIGFWQGTFRDPSSDEFRAAREAIERRDGLTVEILYGDHEGGQRSISRFALTPRSDRSGWIASVARHWNVDRPNPR